MAMEELGDWEALFIDLATRKTKIHILMPDDLKPLN